MCTQYLSPDHELDILAEIVDVLKLMRETYPHTCREVPHPYHLGLMTSSLDRQGFFGMASRRSSNDGNWKSSKRKVRPPLHHVDCRYWGGIISLADAQDGKEKKS